MLDLNQRKTLILGQWEDEDMLAEGISRLAVVISKMQDESYEHVSKPVATEGQAKDFW
jgi:hypothetical protein